MTKSWANPQKSGQCSMAKAGCNPRVLQFIPGFACLVLLLLQIGGASGAEPEWLAGARAAAQAQFVTAQSAYTNNPGSVEASWQMGRACFDLAEVAETKRDRAAVAEQGIAACQRALELSTNCAAAHYYWGMNLGQVARTKGMGALGLVQQLRRHFEAARSLDASFDSAGPDRNLGYLYRDTPSWLSIGDREKAREHLAAAVKLAPDFPENRLALAEGLLAWGEHDRARHELEELEKRVPAARQKLAGPAWAASWADWAERLSKLKKKLGT